MRSRIAQSLTQAIGSTPRNRDRSPLYKGWRIALHLARRLVIRLLNDPTVEIDFHGQAIKLPLSHDLVVISVDYPGYATNLGKLASLVERKYGKSCLIDIGANVGDSVAMVRAHSKLPILAIDGDPGYFSLLLENVSGIPDVECCMALVGNGNSEDQRVELLTTAGTARPVKAHSAGAGLATRRLTSILDDHPAFRSAGLVKIDTDGFDTLIIGSELEFFSNRKPIIFFEYDPSLFRDHDALGFQILQRLHSAGYESALLYDNLGRFHCVVDLADAQLIADIQAYLLGHTPLKYFDIVAFGPADGDICTQLRAMEKGSAPAAGVSHEHS